jgi:predicted negative regulator of RcsB-dependent stress response
MPKLGPGAEKMRHMSFATYVGIIAIGLLGFGAVSVYQYTAHKRAQMAYERCVAAASKKMTSSFDLTNAMNTCKFMHHQTLAQGKYGNRAGPAVRVAMQDRPIL